jgi:hypothetical protein
MKFYSHQRGPTSSKINGIVMLIPKDQDPWMLFRRSLEKFSEDFMDFKRDQGNYEKRDVVS